MPEPCISCRWLRVTEATGWDGDAGRILGTCDLLGDTAYDSRCETCPERRGRDE